MARTTTLQQQLHSHARAVAGSLAVAIEQALPYEQLTALLQQTRHTLGDAHLPEPYQTFLDRLEHHLNRPRPIDSELLRAVATEAGLNELQLTQLLDSVPSYANADYYARQYACAYAWNQRLAWTNQLHNAIRNADYERAKQLLAQSPAPPAPDDPAHREPLLRPLPDYLARYQNLALEFIPLLGVNGLLARGATSLLAASPKSGKTTLLVHACREWLQQGLRIAYLSEEPPVVWNARLQRFPELRDLIISSVPRAHPNEWRRALLSLEPDIVIVDTVRRFAAIADESDPAKVAAALAYFVDLPRDLPRTAVLLAHHTRKSARPDADASVADIAGSHAFTGETDSILTLRNDKHDRQRILTPIEGRLWLTAPEPLVLELAPDGSEYRVLGTYHEILPEQQREASELAILQALHALGAATAQDIADYLHQQGETLSRRWIQNCLNRLADEGLLNRSGTGTRNNPYRYSVPAPNLSGTLELPLRDFHSSRNDDSHSAAPDDPDALTGDALADAIIDLFGGWDAPPETRCYHLQHRATREQRTILADSFQSACQLAGWLPDETALLRIEPYAPA